MDRDDLLYLARMTDADCISTELDWLYLATPAADIDPEPVAARLGIAIARLPDDTDGGRTWHVAGGYIWRNPDTGGLLVSHDCTD
jgi:hypothetical protein